MSNHDWHGRRIQNTTRVGKLTLAPIEVNGVQRHQIQLNAFEVFDNVNSMQLFGFASGTPIGSDAVITCLAGDTTNCNVIATNHNQYRPRVIGTGETIIYDTAGQQIYLSQSGGKLSIKITAGQEVDITAATAVIITAPTVTVVGNLVVNGNLTVTGDTKAGTVSLEHHLHSGVGGGSGSSGPPVP